MAIGRQRTGGPINRDQRRGAPSRAAASDEDNDEGINQKPLSEAERDQAKAKMMATALRMLTARARSEQQLRDKLLAKEWLDHRVLDECIARLQELGYVNDKSFAYQYALSRLQSKALGRARLARELAEKKVPREIIEEALERVFEEVAEDALINKAIEKFIRLHGPPREARQGKKIFAHLMRLGFRYDLISKKLRSLSVDHEEQDQEF
ncbi:MAG: RecX family transcriptional regulator [Acidobacteria bacterium]|nr:RecX family transcriptional regulator [Acidobacteriota bacterium]